MLQTHLHGHGLVRPECVLTHASGLLFAADWDGRGGIAVIDPAADRVAKLHARERTVRPNGILVEDGGTVLLAHLGDTDGGVVRLHPDGACEDVLTEVDGVPLPPTNFVGPGPDGSLYVTVSTRHIPRHAAAHGGAGDGFIVHLPRTGAARIVADGLGYTNECVLDEAGGRLVVNETFGRATSAFHVAPDGSLGPREEVARYGDGLFPDGVALDDEGGLWITSIISNTVLRLAPDGRRQVVLREADADLVDRVERAWGSASLTSDLLGTPHTGRLRNVSSLAFGEPDLRTAYLGTLQGKAIVSFESPFPGRRPAHYDVDVAPLAALVGR